jgi:hypothetical protein
MSYIATASSPTLAALSVGVFIIYGADAHRWRRPSSLVSSLSADIGPHLPTAF